MSDIFTKITEACNTVIQRGIKIRKEVWFIYENGKITECDPIGAILLVNNKVDDSFDFSNLELLSKPGFVKMAIETLNIDFFWLRQFWMGFDRNYISRISYKDSKGVEKESFSTISLFGAQLAKDLKL